jgi:hypothetical protein
MMNNTPYVYVAQIPTYYETIAVSSTADEARRLAGRHALKYLKAQGITDFKTVAQVVDYFGCNVVQCKMNGSVTGY